jgi:CubicO group peptidase (beta-lactamase class C family)
MDAIEILRQRIDVDKKAVGMVCGKVSSKGREVIGHGKLGHDRDQTPDGDTVFEIGSITKLFTAILLADMVERGELALDDPIAKFLPSSVGLPVRGDQEITLLHLATHTSGLARLPDNFAPKDQSNPYVDYTVEHMYEFLSGYTLPRDIGAEYEYSNFGYGLLGHILTLQAGTAYETLVLSRICEPLGMTSTRVRRSPELKAHLATGHDRACRSVPNWDNPTLPGAGVLLSTANDLLIFLAANLGLVDSPLSAAIQNTHSPRDKARGDDEIGLAWLVSHKSETEIRWHNGGTGGYHSFAGFDKERCLGVVVLSNAANDLDDVGFHLLDPSCELKVYRPSRKHTAIPLDPRIFREYEGMYLFSHSSVEIVADENSLYAVLSGGQRLELLPETETQFFFKVDEEIEFIFVGDESGHVTHLIAYQEGQTHEGRKTG